MTTSTKAVKNIPPFRLKVRNIQHKLSVLHNNVINLNNVMHRLYYFQQMVSQNEEAN